MRIEVAGVSILSVRSRFAYYSFLRLQFQLSSATVRACFLLIDPGVVSEAPACASGVFTGSQTGVLFSALLFMK